MSIRVVKQGDVLRIIEGAEDIADGTALVVVPKPVGTGYRQEEAAQLERIFAEEDEDWSAVLAPFRLGPDGAPAAANQSAHG